MVRGSRGVVLWTMLLARERLRTDEQGLWAAYQSTLSDKDERKRTAKRGALQRVAQSYPSPHDGARLALRNHGSSGECCARFVASDEWGYVSSLVMGVYLFIVLLDGWHPLVSTMPGYHDMMFVTNVAFLSFFIIELLVSNQVLDKGVPSFLFLFELCACSAALVLVVLVKEMQRFDSSTADAELISAALPKVAAAARIARMLGLVRIASQAVRARNSDLTNCLKGRAPARGIAKSLAVLIGMIGITLLLTGIINHFEVEQVSFLRVSIPSLADGRLLLVGKLMLGIASISWLCAFCSLRQEMTYFVFMLTCGLLLYVIVSVAATDDIDDWTAALGTQERAHFPDKGFETLARGGGHSSSWPAARRNFERSWRTCDGTVFNSTRVIAACIIAERSRRSQGGAMGPRVLRPPAPPDVRPSAPPFPTKPPPPPAPPTLPWNAERVFHMIWNAQPARDISSHDVARAASDAIARANRDR